MAHSITDLVQKMVDTFTKQKMIASVESSSTASKSYSVGDYLVYNGTLYKVTSTISSGDTIIPDTNVESTMLTNEFGSASTGDMEKAIYDPDDDGIIDIAQGGTGNSDGYIRTGKQSGSSVGTKATAEGNNNIASGNYSHAEGDSCQANGNYSHVEGQNTQADYSHQHISGKYNNNKSDTLLEIGNGTDTNAKSNAFEVTSDGYIRTKNRSDKIAFGIDENGNYGYIKDGADTVTPFKSGGDGYFFEKVKTNTGSEVEINIPFKTENIQISRERDHMPHVTIERDEDNQLVSKLFYLNGTDFSIGFENRTFLNSGNITNNDEFAYCNAKVSDSIPYHFYESGAVVLNNEIHILGSIYSSSLYTKHYKWDGSSWVSVSTLPYHFYGSGAVVLNNEIHILGSSYGDDDTKHYKWDGSSWVSVSTLPYNFHQGAAVVLNNEIHILGGAGNRSAKHLTNHYKWDGSSWVSVSTLPYELNNGSAVVLNNEIHILGGSQRTNTYTNHYKWDGSSWVSVSTLPYNFYQGAAVVLNNEIHILGSGYVNSGTNHYKWDGSSWVSVIVPPYNFYRGSAVVLNNEIHILGGAGNMDSHYKYLQPFLDMITYYLVENNTTTIRYKLNTVNPSEDFYEYVTAIPFQDD